jgi:dTMP kinase
VAGRFIVVEGGDGAGKSSVIGALAEFLVAGGAQVRLTREPGGTSEGLGLRALLLAKGSPGWDDRAELLLMTADRVQHVQRVILPALEAGQTVLCDRFVGSTLAYQGAGRGIEPADILALHRDFVGDLWPDLTVWLDIDPELGLVRSRRRMAQLGGRDEGRFEALDQAFHRRVRACYRQMATERGWAVIDASQPLDFVVNQAKAAVDLGPAPI